MEAEDRNGRTRDGWWQVVSGRVDDWVWQLVVIDVMKARAEQRRRFGDARRDCGAAAYYFDVRACPFVDGGNRGFARLAKLGERGACEVKWRGRVGTGGRAGEDEAGSCEGGGPEGCGRVG